MRIWSKISLRGIRARQFLKEEGSFPMFAIIVVSLLIFTGLAFMKWGADEGWEAKYEAAKLQAYYAAHAGIMNSGFDYLRHLDINEVPDNKASKILGSDTVIKDAKGKTIAAVEGCWVQKRINPQGMGLGDANFVDCWAVGRTDFEDYEGKDVSVWDSLSLSVKTLSVSNYLYLTNIEKTVFNEVIKFWDQDTLDGWVHSNDTITMMDGPGPAPGPVFYDKVSTTAPIINVLSGTPQYLGGPPMLEYREIELPDEATEIRNAAAAAGTYFNNPGDQWWHRLVFRDQQGWVLYWWPAGTPFMDSVRAYGPPPTWQAIFVEGYLELQGIVRGQVTVGASGGSDHNHNWIRLIDDIRYWCSDPVTGRFDDSTGAVSDILGIVSEGDIVIGDTPANGRGNMGQGGSNIIINGALVALDESFTFEYQNDDPTYLWEFSPGDYFGPTPDERGVIFLTGAVTQYRRGYVHRSNHNGTGYDKQYKFDQRLNDMSPPYFIDATDTEGYALFEIVSWETR